MTSRHVTTDPTSAVDMVVVNSSRGHVRLNSSLIGRNLTVHCSAVNVVNLTSHDDNITITLSVVGLSLSLCHVTVSQHHVERRRFVSESMSRYS